MQRVTEILRSHCAQTSTRLDAPPGGARRGDTAGTAGGDRGAGLVAPGGLRHRLPASPGGLQGVHGGLGARSHPQKNRGAGGSRGRGRDARCGVPQHLRGGDGNAGGSTCPAPPPNPGLVFFGGEPGKCIAGTGGRGLGKGWVLEGRGLCAVAPEREAELAGNDVNGERERLCRGGGERAARELTP